MWKKSHEFYEIIMYITNYRGVGYKWILDFQGVHQTTKSSHKMMKNDTSPNSLAQNLPPTLKPWIPMGFDQEIEN